MIAPEVEQILRDPVTLEPLGVGGPAVENGYLDASVSPHSAKNLAELTFARDEYTEPDGLSYVQRLPHMEHPPIEPSDVVLDVGCGPRSFLGGMPGHHVFLDDLIGSYITQLGSRFDGLAVNARTELMPFADSSIQVIYCINMLDHVDDLPDTIAELHRVLDPNGILVLQTYFNSHPLLPSEPGVVDRYAYDELIKPLFEGTQVATHCVQGPEISDYYTMGILTGLFRKRTGVSASRRPRELYSAEGYVPPQSRITECLLAIEKSDFDRARAYIDHLHQEPHYRFHGMLLESKLAIASGKPGEVHDWLRQAREDPRGQRNPYARLAIKDLEVERLQAHAALFADRTNGAISQRDKRVAELDGAIIQRDKRIAELDGAIIQRDKRIAELQASVRELDLRIQKFAEQTDESDS